MHFHRIRRKLFLHGEAVIIHGRAPAGGSRPPMVTAVDSDGAAFEAYLKSPNLHSRPTRSVVEREWMAANLAELLGLPCARPAKIRLSPHLIETVQDPSLRRQLQEGPDILFGSISGGPGWHIWGSSSKLPRSKLQLATEVYVFDTIIQNWDRSVVNPNLLARGEDLLMIDHDESFVASTGTPQEQDFTPPPWQLNGISNHEGEYEEHPLWCRLRPKNRVDLKAAADRWKALPADACTLYAQDVPSCWDLSATLRIAEYLHQAVDRIEDIMSIIEHNLLR